MNWNFHRKSHTCTNNRATGSYCCNKDISYSFSEQLFHVGASGHSGQYEPAVWNSKVNTSPPHLQYHILVQLPNQQRQNKMTGSPQTPLSHLYERSVIRKAVLRGGSRSHGLEATELKCSYLQY